MRTKDRRKGGEGQGGGMTMICAASGDSAHAMRHAPPPGKNISRIPPPGPRTAANWRQKQISWNSEQKRDVGSGADG
eukprot:688326-Pyramimonas_sp.AAC.1